MQLLQLSSHSVEQVQGCAAHGLLLGFILWGRRAPWLEPVLSDKV